MSVSTGDSSCHNHLMRVPFALGLQPTHLLRCLLLPSVGRLFAISGYCLSCYISVYICYWTTPKMWGHFTHAPIQKGHPRHETSQIVIGTTDYIRIYVCRSKLYMCTHCTSCGGRILVHSRCFTWLNHKNNLGNTFTGTRSRVTCWTLPWMSAGTG